MEFLWGPGSGRKIAQGGQEDSFCLRILTQRPSCSAYCPHHCTVLTADIISCLHFVCVLLLLSAFMFNLLQYIIYRNIYTK